MKKSGLLKRLTSLILGTAMTMSMFASSFAGTPVSIIDENKMGSIEITKMATDGVTPLSGVEFSYIKVADIVQEGDGTSPEYMVKYQLTIDGMHILTGIGSAPGNIYTGTEINEFMKNNNIMSPTYPGYQRGTVVDGKVKFENLPLGIYLVEETDSTGATIDGEPVDVNKGVGPFLVSVPQTNPEGTEWVYDVKVKAKNIVDDETVTKEVEGDFITIVDGNNNEEIITGAIGSTLWYTVTGTVSKVNDESLYTKYVISDSLSDALRYGEKGDSETIIKSKIAVSIMEDGAETPLTVGTDFIITYNLDDSTQGDKKESFTIELTQDGLDILNAEAKQRPSEIIVTYPAHITGEIVEYVAENEAKITVGHNGGEDSEKGTSVEVFPLGVEINKLFDGELIENLNDDTIDPTQVEFKLALDDNGTLKPIFMQKLAGDNDIYLADLSVTAADQDFSETFKLSADGTVQVIGIPSGKYVITEVKTAEGYSLLKEPIEIEVTKDEIVSVPDGERPFEDKIFIVVNNEKTPAFELPSTGGVGTVLYTLGGILLLLAAASLYLSSGKKNSFN